MVRQISFFQQQLTYIGSISFKIQQFIQSLNIHSQNFIKMVVIYLCNFFVYSRYQVIKGLKFYFELRIFNLKLFTQNIFHILAIKKTIMSVQIKFWKSFCMLLVKIVFIHQKEEFARNFILLTFISFNQKFFIVNTLLIL